MARKAASSTCRFALLGVMVIFLIFCQSAFSADGMGGNPALMNVPSPGSGYPASPIKPSGFAVEGFAGGDTSLSGSYQTTAGQTIPYDFGSGPLWGIRIGKMIFSPIFVYLTFQQSYFSTNTHTLVGFGGQYYLPRPPHLPFVPYINATFGGSYNTFTGPNAQAGYAWMLGSGIVFPVTKSAGVFLEADASYETAPTGISTSVGSPPGNITRVSDTWSLPVVVGIRYAF